MSDALQPLSSAFLALKHAQDDGRNGIYEPSSIIGYVGGRHGPHEVWGGGGARDQKCTKKHKYVDP